MLLGISSIYANIRAVPALAVAIDEEFAADRALPALVTLVELPFGLGSLSSPLPKIAPPGDYPVQNRLVFIDFIALFLRSRCSGNGMATIDQIPGPPMPIGLRPRY
jgi:hypothetical protein